MLANALKVIFGSRNDRLLKEYRGKVVSINALEKDLERLSDAELQAKTPELKQKVANGAKLDAVLPRPSRSCARPPGACSACATSTCR